MRLRDLDPVFIRRKIKVETQTYVLGDPLKWRPGDPTEERTGPVEYHVPVASLAEADGVQFLCPKCFVAKDGPVGCHWVLCWRPHVPPDVDPKPGRWEFLGTGLDDLTLHAGSSSIQLVGGCTAHFFIEQGTVRMA